MCVCARSHLVWATPDSAQSTPCVAAYLTHLSAIAFPLHLPGVFAGLQALWK